MLRTLRVCVTARPLRRRIDSTEFRAGHRWRRLTKEQPIEGPDAVGDVDPAAVVRIGGIQAGKHLIPREEEAERGDAVGDVHSPVGV